VIPVHTLAELVVHLRGEISIAPAPSADALLDLTPPVYATDFSEVRGQEHVKRALEVAAARPPGAGKTLLARALPSVLPAALDLAEALEATKIARRRARSAPPLPDPLTERMPVQQPGSMCRSDSPPCSETPPASATCRRRVASRLPPSAPLQTAADSRSRPHW
jgi:predicted ATPase with chaperone activity